MFTGLVECMGRVLAIARASGGTTEISIEAPKIASEIVAGESVAVAGVCLTALNSGGNSFRAQMMNETVSSTRLGGVKPGEYVNLERALKFGGRLDGHLVLGHVDEVGNIADVEPCGDSKKIWITASEKISWGIAAKGSVAIDGVSLTVIDAGENRFSIGLIPTTLADTTLCFLEKGKKVNIEIDVLARYIARLCGRAQVSDKKELTWRALTEYGW